MTETADLLAATAALWRTTNRQLVTSFLGTSMLPTIAPGVEVTIDCGREAAVGDVIAYTVGGHVVVHRIVGASPAFLLTRGDNVAIPDDPYDPSVGLIGVVTAPHYRPTWWQERVLRAVPMADAAICRRRLHLFRAIGTVITVGPRAVRKLWRLLRRRA